MFAHGYFPKSYGNASFDCGVNVGKIPTISEIEEEWYPSQWQAALEPSLHLLSEQKTSNFVLRFSYIPSFGPSIFIRIHKEGKRYKLIVKKMSGFGGYDPGVISESKEIHLSPKQVSELNKLLNKEKLFEEAAAICDFGFDGSEWIFETADSNGYKMVKRWTPFDGAAYNVGEYLFLLSECPIDQW